MKTVNLVNLERVLQSVALEALQTTRMRLEPKALKPKLRATTVDRALLDHQVYLATKENEDREEIKELKE